ncbi:MAG: YIP1 family protein [archaeon]|nr:MAG: YIP1 family protein [archaeon]
MIDFNLWKEVLLNPKETFKKQEKNADLGKATVHLVIAGLIAGFIGGLAAAAGLTATGGMAGLGPGITGAGLGIIAFVGSLIITPIVSVVGWLVGSAILYVFALIFQGKGNYTTQSYLLGLYWAPLIIITAILGIIPFIGGILNFLVALYGLYLLTMALKQAHKVSTGKAVAIWIIPVIVLAVLVSILAVGFLMAMMPMMAAI